MNLSSVSQHKSVRSSRLSRSDRLFYLSFFFDIIKNNVQKSKNGKLTLTSIYKLHFVILVQMYLFSYEL